MPKSDDTTPAARRPRARYTIQAAPGREISCTACERRFPGFGLIGCHDDAPVCDRCLFDGDAGLGMALALIAVTRTYATIVGTNPEQQLEPLQELGAFAVVYERFAIRNGPPRLFPVPDVMADESTPPPVVERRPRESP